MTNEHTSLEKYTSHSLFKTVAKGLCVKGELETEQTATYWPSSSDYSSTSFSFCWAAQPCSWGPTPSAGSWFSLPRTVTPTPTNWFQLTRNVCGAGLYNCLTSTCFPWASRLHRFQPIHGSRWYLRYVRPDVPVSLVCVISWLIVRASEKE